MTESQKDKPWIGAVRRLLPTEKRLDPRPKPGRAAQLKYWNQTDLAEACEIRGTTLSHILNGKTQPDLDTLITLAKVLGVSLATLLMDDDEAEAYAEFQKSRATLKESNAFEDRLNRLLEQRADEMKAEWIAMQRRRALEEMKEPEKADPPEPEVALRKRKHGR